MFSRRNLMCDCQKTKTARSFLLSHVFSSDQCSVFQDSGIRNHLYHEDNLVHSALNLFAAGTDTTASTLQWGLLYMTKYPHIQGAMMHTDFLFQI